jgi:hypothetical protein
MRHCSDVDDGDDPRRHVVPGPCLHPLSRYSRGQPLDDGVVFVWPTSSTRTVFGKSRDSARPSGALPAVGIYRCTGFR